MKKIKLIGVIIILTIIGMATAQLSAQNDDKRFTYSLYTDPGASVNEAKQGNSWFNIGTAIEYQMTITYFKAQVFVFPDLRGNTYLEMAGVPLGINIHAGQWEQVRMYQGLKIGGIKRVGAPVTGFIGLEGGLEFYPKPLKKNGIYYGVMGSYDYRGDGGIWENHARSYWRASGFIKIGYAY